MTKQQVNFLTAARARVVFASFPAGTALADAAAMRGIWLSGWMLCTSSLFLACGSNDGGAHSAAGGSGAVGAGGVPSTGGSAGALGGGAGAAGSSSFVVAAHTPYPSVPNQGGHELTHPTLVTITFANDPHRAELEAFGDFIVSSKWLTQVGAEYGIEAGSHLAKVELGDAAPASIGDPEVQALLAQKLADGTVPSATMDPSDDLYVLYFPPTSAVTDGNGKSCADFFGYHSDMLAGGKHVSYAVIVACGDNAIPGVKELGQIEYASSHEIIEAAENAFPHNGPGYTFTDSNDPWRYFGRETADLCLGRIVTEAGHTLTKNWSNARAAADQDPCVPEPASHSYGVSPTLLEVQHVTAGQSVEYDVTAWTSAALGSFFFAPMVYGGNFAATVKSSADSLSNGQSAKVTITVPPGTPPGSRCIVDLFNGYSDNDFHDWPVMVLAE